MEILVVFLMGTGHRGDESDSTIPSLFRNSKAKNLGTHRADSGEIILSKEDKIGQDQCSQRSIFEIAGFRQHGAV